MNNTVLLILATLAVVALIDYIPRAFLLVKKAIPTRVGYGPIPRFLIMPSVYGDISYLKNTSFLKRYAKHVVVCTSMHETPEFYADLRRVCRQYGLRYIRAELPLVGGQPVKNAYTIYKGALRKLSQLGARRNTPCILIDADTYADRNVNNLVRTFIASNLDIASLRCEVARPKTVIEQLQAFEYRLAMDNRRMDPWLTSGACNVGKAGALQHIFSRHSDFFAGGDIEIGKLARVMGYRVNHINFTFFTAAPDNLRDWFNQRVIWFAGGTRHHVANIASFGWFHFFMFFYNSLLIYLLFPLRWIEVINFPLTLLVLVVLSWIYTAILTIGTGWQHVYLLLPFYSFVQSMVILPFAIKRYCQLVWQQRSLGLLKYDLSRVPLRSRLLYRVLNISSATLVIYAAVVFTTSRLHYWMDNGAVMHYLQGLIK